MEIVKIKCPNCDAPIEISKEGACKCPYCGASFMAERDDDNIIINTTINNFTGESPSRYSTPVSDKKKKLSGVILALIAIGIISAAMITLLILGLLIKGLSGMGPADTTEVRKEYIYRDAVESDYMKGLVEDMFGKAAADVTAEDYSRVKELHFTSLGSISDDWHMDYVLDDGESHAFITDHDLYDSSDFYIPWEDIQPFTGLEVLDCDNCSEFNRVNTYSSDKLPASLANLTALREFRAPTYFDASDLDGFFADDTLKVLSVCVSKEYAPVELIVESEPQIEELYLTSYTDDMADMTAVSELSNLKIVQVPYIGQDMGFLSSLDQLEGLQLVCDDTVSDFSFLYGLGNLKSLAIANAVSLKEIGFIDDMPDLESLSIAESVVLDFDKLTDKTSITTLVLKDNNNVSDYSFLSSLTGLTDLYLSMSLWSKEVIMPNLSVLPNLTTVVLPSDIEASVSGCQTLQSLYLLTGNSTNDLSRLNNLPALEYLNIGYEGDSNVYLKSLESLGGFTSLRTLVLNDQYIYGDMEIDEDFSDVLNLPYLEQLYVYGDFVYIYCFDPERVQPNDHLKVLYLTKGRVRIKSGENVDWNTDHYLGEYSDVFGHFTAIEELSIADAQISDLSFAESLPELRKLDISGNYVQDVSPLTSCANLTYVNVTGNPVQNTDILPDTVAVIK